MSGRDTSDFTNEHAERAAGRSWSFECVVTPVGGSEGQWLRDELAEVVVELASWVSRAPSLAIDEEEDRAA